VRGTPPRSTKANPASARRSHASLDCDECNYQVSFKVGHSFMAGSDQVLMFVASGADEKLPQSGELPMRR
jgi:hypothetical protein